MGRIYLVRHAQAQLNAENYDQLSTLGEQQAQFLGQYWQALGLSFDQVYCGDLRRQQHTQHILQEHVGVIDESYCLPELNEYDFKQVIKSYQQLTENKKDFIQLEGKEQFRLLRDAITAWAQGQLANTQAPCFSQFALNVANAREHIGQNAGKANNVLVVSSGGVIAVWLQTLLGLTPSQAMLLNLQIRNTAVSEFYSRQHEMQLVSFNHVGHLEHPQRIHALTYS